MPKDKGLLLHVCYKAELLKLSTQMISNEQMESSLIAKILKIIDLATECEETEVIKTQPGHATSHKSKKPRREDCLDDIVTAA